MPPPMTWYWCSMINHGLQIFVSFVFRSVFLFVYSKKSLFRVFFQQEIDIIRHNMSALTLTSLLI